ncbi:zinc-binding loop region of homing endonuclease-domain-containing protein [Lipomyces kononenkoae]
MNAHNLDLITPTKANEIVNYYHHKTTSLGCWESNLQLNNCGYHTVCVSAGGKRITIKLHQLTLVANNRLDELNLTLGSFSFDVSHLCHNTRCFSAQHLVVESRQTNRARQACNGQKILVHDEFSYHPCSHGSVEKMRKCILPVQRLCDTMANRDEQTSTEESPAPDLDDTVKDNNDTHKINQVTPTKALELISWYHVATTDLGCWQTWLKPNHAGFCRVKVWHQQEFSLHHLAMIADNRGAELERALGRQSYHSVSHLCHNQLCFNPQHLIVEPKTDLRKRKECKGKTILVRDGIIDHPCGHGGVDRMHKCILPVQDAPDKMPNSREQTSTEATPAPCLDDTAAGSNDADKLGHITPLMAQELVNRYRAVTTDLGCWESNMRPSCRGRYVRLKLRKLHCRPFLHQIAVIADNRGAELKMTLKSNRFHVSHLCHNDLCFNSDHLIVESSTNNLRRRTCVGHKVIIYGPFEFHPCRHGEVEKMRKCILPLLRLGAGHHVNDTE